MKNTKFKRINQNNCLTSLDFFKELIQSSRGRKTYFERILFKQCVLKSKKKNVISKTKKYHVNSIWTSKIFMASTFSNFGVEIEETKIYVDSRIVLNLYD